VLGIVDQQPRSSANAVCASSKDTPCFCRLVLFFRSSHSVEAQPPVHCTYVVRIRNACRRLSDGRGAGQERCAGERTRGAQPTQRKRHPARASLRASRGLTE
jgi:hypothetical protein